MSESSQLSFAGGFWFGSEGRGAPPEAPKEELERGLESAAQVLIVEDELLAAWHVESILQDLGHAVCGIAAKGEEAVHAAANLDPDIIFMDVNLGAGFDGVEAARRILAAARVPIIFLTAYSDPGTRQRITAAFPNAPILGKPVSPEAIRRAISQQLDPTRSGKRETED